MVSVAALTTVTVTVQRGSAPPAGQLLPAVGEVTVLARTGRRCRGCSTVTEYVMVAAAPGARSPVQVRSGLA